VHAGPPAKGALSARCGESASGGKVRYTSGAAGDDEAGIAISHGQLGLSLFHVRIGIASGDVLLGYVGTYHKMEFTAIGATVNLAGALRNEALARAADQPGDV
jgi:class 3 adenylate cyclase